MKTIQYHGPLPVGPLNPPIKLDSVYKILQIGVERPLSIPISVYQNNNINSNNEFMAVVPLLRIDGKEYAISEKDILEYEGLYQSSIDIYLLQPVDKYTIIDLVFKDVDE